MKDTSPLLPSCAYCGHEIEFEQLGSISYSHAHWYWSCPDCGINRQSHTQFSTKEQAIADANRRPAPASPSAPDVVEANKQDAADLHECIRKAQAAMISKIQESLNEIHGHHFSERVYSAMLDKIQFLEAKVAALSQPKAASDKLVAALKFYADESNYDEDGCPMQKLKNIFDQEVKEPDFGDTARAALSHNGERSDQATEAKIKELRTALKECRPHIEMIEDSSDEWSSKDCRRIMGLIDAALNGEPDPNSKEGKS